jgi:hypothetical protein
MHVPFPSLQNFFVFSFDHPKQNSFGTALTSKAIQLGKRRSCIATAWLHECVQTGN